MAELNYYSVSVIWFDRLRASIGGMVCVWGGDVAEGEENVAEEGGGGVPR